MPMDITTGTLRYGLLVDHQAKALRKVFYCISYKMVSVQRRPSLSGM